MPGELRHFELVAGDIESDVVRTVLGWLGRKPAKSSIEARALTTGTWGIASDELAVGWAHVDALKYRQVRRGSDEPEVLVSELDVELRDVVWRGQCPLNPSLDVLVAVYPLFATEARREIALGFSPTAPSERTRPGLFDLLLRYAREWLASPEGVEETQVVTSHYRTQERALRPAFLTELELALVAAPIAADRGPFAAIVAAELRVTTMLDHLSMLTASPQSFLAAIATGAALRLGESPIRVGKVEHVEPYIDADTARAIAAWAAG